MFHISPTRNRDSIQEHGLHADEPPDTGWAQYVWLFATREDAEPFLGKSFGCSRGENDLWEVDVDGLEIIPDRDPGWPGVSTWMHDGPVSPDRLCRVTQGA